MAKSPRAKVKRDFREEATNLIVDMLEKGTAPWQRPWDKNAAAQQLELPHNGATGRAYTGGNALYLMAKGMQEGYDDPRWMTYEQAHSKGWQVRKGEKATLVEFWQFEKTEKTKDPTTGKDGEQRVKRDRPLQRLYSVFNANQIDGVPPLERSENQHREEWEIIELAERALINSGAKIKHNGSEAFYSPVNDEITLPPKNVFSDQAAYYGTALHELGHWTGHESRLKRDGITGRHRFGSEGYAREELRAEMASVFMQAELGVSHDINRHASYVNSWIDVLKKDKNEFFRAAKDAGQAADFVLELTKEKEKDQACQLVRSQSEATYECSRLDAEDIAADECEEGHKETNTQSGTYVGGIVGLTDFHVVQARGKRVAVIHHKADLDRVPEQGEMVKVIYKDGRGTVEPKSKEHGQER